MGQVKFTFAVSSLESSAPLRVAIVTHKVVTLPVLFAVSVFVVVMSQHGRPAKKRKTFAGKHAALFGASLPSRLVMNARRRKGGP